jgi:phenylalanyl-tRNA synthetase alpha chain
MTQVMGRSAILMLRKVHITNCFFLRTVSIRYLTTPTPESVTSVKETLGNYDLHHPECNTPLNIASRIGTNLHHKNTHPLGIIKNIIQNYWNEKENQGNPSGNGFSCLDSLSPVVSTNANFDSLLIPSDHVSRIRSDTYYLRNDTVLRTHTSAHQVELLSKPFGYDKFLVTGDVYRRDEIDKSHYPIFHQMEGVKVFTSIDDVKMVEDDLKIGLEGMARTLFGDVEMRWVPAYFPFTEPSFELEIHFQGEWLEVLGCGIIQPGILRNAGRSEKDVGWAFGLGLERLAMVLFDIPDIRLFWSTDERFTKQFLSGKIVKFVPYSKYPPCFKDITFWVPPEFHPNDLNELVRDIAGDLVEKIQLMDEFTHPKTQRLSNCFRITYRSMDRSLTNEEIDDLQWKVREAVIEKLGAELR